MVTQNLKTAWHLHRLQKHREVWEALAAGTAVWNSRAERSEAERSRNMQCPTKIFRMSSTGLSEASEQIESGEERTKDVQAKPCLEPIRASDSEHPDCRTLPKSRGGAQRLRRLLAIASPEWFRDEFPDKFSCFLKEDNKIQIFKAINLLVSSIQCKLPMKQRCHT